MNLCVTWLCRHTQTMTSRILTTFWVNIITVFFLVMPNDAIPIVMHVCLHENNVFLTSAGRSVSYAQWVLNQAERWRGHLRYVTVSTRTVTSPLKVITLWRDAITWMFRHPILFLRVGGVVSCSLCVCDETPRSRDCVVMPSCAMTSPLHSYLLTPVANAY